MDVNSKKRYYPRFIEVLEIIYALFFAVGLYDILVKWNNDILYLISLGICLLVLIRFFFAPSKNVKAVIKNITESNLSLEEKDKQYRIVLIVDVLALFIHAIIFVRMCAYAKIVSLSNIDLSIFKMFVILLIVNVFWLGYIKYRIEKFKRICPTNIKFWIKNNTQCSIPIIIILCLRFLPFELKIFHQFQFYLLLFFAYLNCLRDLWKTYRAYLFDD